MSASILCPLCGHVCRQPLPEVKEGQTRCPGCLNLFPLPKPPAPSLLARSGARSAKPPPADNPNRTLLAQPEPMIRYVCPRCKKSLESPASFAGQKLNCPDCNQRLQIPQPSTPAAPPINKTILATEDPPPQPQTAAAPPARAANDPANQPRMDILDVVEESPSSATAAPRRENCLECGADLAYQSRTQNCPNCGALFCSARCYREHHYNAHARRQNYRDFPVAQPAEPSTGMAVAGMVLGICAVVLAIIPCIGWIGIIAGILGAVFSSIGLAQGLKQEVGKNMAITGLSLSILAIILWPLLLAFWLAIISTH